MFLYTRKKIYEFKIGLKGLILMRENASLLAMKDKRFILYCGLICQHPNITFPEIDEILEECDLSNLDVSQYTILSIYEVAELYTKAIGEIGIAPTDFYLMTPEEIDLAYEGYLRRKEIEANLTKIAILTQENDELIRLTEDKLYEIGSKAERQATFQLLLGREQ